MKGTAYLFLCFLVLYPGFAGRLIIGLSLTLSGRFDEVQKGNEVKRTLELLLEEANLQSLRGRGFRDSRGNDLIFELLVLDDGGNPEQVRQIYRNMIERRLADLFLGPQTHALSQVAAKVAWERQRTLMMYNHHTLPEAAYRPDANRPGVFSVSLPARDHMLEGLRMAQSLGAHSLAVIYRPTPMLREMCQLDWPSVSRPPPMVVAEENSTTDGYEMLLAMQRVVAKEPDVIMTCADELDTAMAIVAASRVNTSAKMMLVYNADTNAVYNGVAGTVDYLLAPSSWHFTQNHSCRVFGSTNNFVERYRAQFGRLPSTLDASALGAALAVMTAVESTVYEGEDTEKNLRLTQTLRSGAGAETSYGFVQFRPDGTSPRRALTLQLRAQELTWTSSIVTETNLSSLVFPLPSWASKDQRGASTCVEAGAGYIINPNIFNSSGSLDCLPCPAGETNSANSQYCTVCPAGTYAMTSGSACLPCAQGADCRQQGTSRPPSLPAWYRLDSHESNVPIFVPCLWDHLCLGNNVCSGSNAGVRCDSCIPGHTNLGFFRKSGECGACLPGPLLGVFFVIYICVVYFIIAKTAQASEEGQLWKRVVAYCQLCSAATKASFLNTRNPILELLTDTILYPFHSILGPDCLFAASGSMSKETFVFVLGIALLPCLFLLTTMVFFVRRGLNQRKSSRKRLGSTGGDRRKFAKDFVFTVARDATRWSVATLYVLYCPTLAIFLGSLSFIWLDVLRLRHFPDVLVTDVFEFSIISGAVAVLQGCAIPVSLYLIIRRLKKRHLLKDENWQYVFGMLYNDMKPEFWYFEILLFFQKFAFIAATAIPFPILRIFALLGVAFTHTVSLLLFQPFSNVNNYILMKLEYSFLLSIIVILSMQVLLLWASANPDPTFWNNFQVIAPICAFAVHGIFAFLALRAFLVCLVYHPLMLKAIAMPQAMDRAERFVCPVDSIQRMSWDKEHQRINFQGFSRRQRRRLCEMLTSALDAYIFTRHAKPVFHASFLCLAVDKAIDNCQQIRTEQLKATHAKMLVQQKRGGCLGLVQYWCPLTAAAPPPPAEGIALAKQQRADRRSLLAALPRVCTPQATIDELRMVFERQHHKILKGKDPYFKIMDTPIELKYGPQLETKEQRRKTAKKSELMRVLHANSLQRASNEAGTSLANAEQEVDTRMFSVEQFRQRLPDLRKQVSELRKTKERLRRDLEEVQAQIEVHKAMLADSDDEPAQEEHL